MKLSVITLSYDNENFTRAFVNSIRENTTLPYELIIVDNGSEPATQKWVEEAADKSIIFKKTRAFQEVSMKVLKLLRGNISCWQTMIRSSLLIGINYF